MDFIEQISNFFDRLRILKDPDSEIDESHILVLTDTQVDDPLLCRYMDKSGNIIDLRLNNDGEIFDINKSRC